MKSAKITTIDAAGRLVVPKDLREAVGMSPGSSVEITLRESHLELAPLPRAIRLEQEGTITVAVPVEPSEPLRTEQVAETRKALRGGREASG